MQKKMATINNNFEELVKSSIENKDVVETVLDFIEMRKLIKKPMTERAVKILINKIPKIAGNSTATQIKVLEQSIINNWLDIYPLRNDVSPSQSTFTTVY